jgi:glycine/D-amino acid oxidase-like deaminating enzyme
MPQLINNCGTIRIPKNEIDKIKFKSYIPYINFKFQEKEGGFLFDISSVVKSTKICQALTKDINKLLNYNVKSIKYEKNLWIIDEKIKTKKLILCNGASANLIDEPYFKIRKIWGQRIVCHTTTKLKYNYHKNCSISQTVKIDETKNLISIGATHKRDKLDEKTTKKETDELILKANEIKDIKNLEVVDQLGGFRACSIDYFPIVGEIIKHTKTLQEFPYLKHGTNVNEKRFTKYKNLYCLNGVGGRGFVLAPYLANVLADFIIDGKKLDNTITTTRLFKRWVKKQ